MSRSRSVQNACKVPEELLVDVDTPKLIERGGAESGRVVKRGIAVVVVKFCHTVVVIFVHVGEQDDFDLLRL
jgi:hypothetical protein